MIERYTFISPEHYDLPGVKDKFPHLVKYGESYIVQYASPGESVEMKTMVDSFGLNLVRYEETTAQMIIDAVTSGFGNNVYNCNIDIALDVCRHFTLDDT